MSSPEPGLLSFEGKARDEQLLIKMIPGEVQKLLNPIWEVQLLLLQAEVRVTPIHQPICDAFAVLIILMAVLVLLHRPMLTLLGVKSK